MIQERYTLLVRPLEGVISYSEIVQYLSLRKDWILVALKLFVVRAATLLFRRPYVCAFIFIFKNLLKFYSWCFYIELISLFVFVIYTIGSFLLNFCCFIDREQTIFDDDKIWKFICFGITDPDFLGVFRWFKSILDMYDLIQLTDTL